MPLRIGTAVILHNPEADVIENISTYAGALEKLIVVDNSEPVPAQLALPHCDRISMGGNKGVAAALNRAAEVAISHGLDWLLTMDQDSRFEGVQLEEYMRAFDAIADKELVAVVSPSFGHAETKRRDADIKDVDYVMTSFNLLNLSIFPRVGGFNEGLFIDEVDHDYCLRARRLGYRIVQILSVAVSHAPGEQIMVTARGVPLTIALHTPERLYYITRNYLYMWRKYRGDFPEVVLARRKRCIIVAKETFRYRERKLRTLYEILRGIIHFAIGRFGR